MGTETVVSAKGPGHLLENVSSTQDMKPASVKSQQYGHLHKAQTMISPADMLTWREETQLSPVFRGRATREDSRGTGKEMM